MAGLSELGKLLHEEHFRILMLVCDLEHRVTGDAGNIPLDPSCGEDRSQLQELLFSLEQIVDHNRFEERELFPLICANGEQDLTALLTDEHLAIGPLASRLHEVAEAILDRGITSDRWAEFRSVATALVAEMMFHLQKEEMAVVQRLSAFLDSQLDHALASKHRSERPPVKAKYAFVRDPTLAGAANAPCPA